MRKNPPRYFRYAFLFPTRPATTKLRDEPTSRWPGKSDTKFLSYLCACVRECMRLCLYVCVYVARCRCPCNDQYLPASARVRALIGSFSLYGRSDGVGKWGKRKVKERKAGKARASGNKGICVAFSNRKSELRAYSGRASLPCTAN